MQICCTKDLQKEIGIVAEPGTEEKDLFCWSAHIFTVNRKKTVAVFNDSNRFGFVFYGLKAKDMKNFKGLILEGIRRSLTDEKIKQEIIDRYLESAGEITFAKTRGPKYVSRLNKACEALKEFYDDFNPSEIYQSSAAKWINTDFVKVDKQSEYEHPYNLIIKDLESFTGNDIISCKAVNLIIKLNLHKYTAWRRIITPVDITFWQLHKQLQTAFGWKEQHLHSFNIFDETGRCVQTVISINEEVYDSYRDSKVLIDEEVMLSEYLNDKYKIVYCYDYGDNWSHEITIANINTDFDKNYPVCLMGEGNTPPEDVGGVSGFIEFLNIISNPSHEEYKHIYEWAKSQGYKEFDIEAVNRMLKGVLKWY